MEMNQIRGLLHRWGHAQDIIRAKQDMLECSRAVYAAAMDTLRGASTLLPGGASSGPGDPVARAVLEAERLERGMQDVRERVAETIRDVLRLRNLIDLILLELPEVQRRVVRMRFEDDRKWLYVARALGMTVEGAKYHEKKALKEIEKNFETLPATIFRMM